MFLALGKFLLRTWPVVLAVWAVAFLLAAYFAPPWGSVVKGGQFVFLPEHFPSRRAEALMEQAFPGRLQSSGVVVVVHRDGDGARLKDEDRKFISDVLRPRLEKLLPSDDEVSASSDKGHRPPAVSAIRTFQDHGIGPLLVSADGQASLVVVELSTDFMEYRNVAVVGTVEEIVDSVQREGRVPEGLLLALSGSATLGRDILIAEKSSAEAAENWTLVLVVLMLLAIYRAPLLAIVPLLTLFCAVQLSLRLLSMLAQGGHITLFEGLEVYAMIIAYGPGVDYCLFLVARYRENLDLGSEPRKALRNSIEQVGAAITASAGTVICGIAMLGFAEFGKFREAGVSIAFCLLMVLIAILTFTPALLLLGGRWAFWPLQEAKAPPPRRPAQGTSANEPHALVPAESEWAHAFWRKVAQLVERSPGWAWSGTVLIMLPFAVAGAIFYDDVSFGLIEELPASTPSVQGAAALKRHFPRGITGAAVVLVRNDQVNFGESEGREAVDRFVERVASHAEGLDIVDIRSVSEPLGRTEAAKSAFASLPKRERIVANARANQRARDFYVSHAGELEGHVTRVDLVLNLDPFSLQAAARLNEIERMLQAEAAAVVGPTTQVLLQGPTASVRDVDRISVSDRKRINVLVTVCVFAILVVLLRKFGLSVYLMASVIFSYLVTLGIAYLLFWYLHGPGFPGLDWTVPIFLFVVLVAVGEDYNIFLMTRIHEEQEEHGVVHGIATALERTGNIITSCGIIMAGTFGSFMAGTIARMTQLGFALAFGVLLDTFVVRPVLVPAWLLMIHKFRPAAAAVPAPAGVDTHPHQAPEPEDKSD